MGSAKKVSRILADVAVLFVVFLAAPVFAAAPDEEPPVLLRSVTVSTPLPAMGSGLAPEARVRVSINERGRVTEVEILSLQPPNRFDEVYRQAVRDQLLALRYAPARVGGKSRPTQLEWTVKFPPAGGDDFSGGTKSPEPQGPGASTPPPKPSRPQEDLRPREVVEAETRERKQRELARKAVELQKATLLKWSTIAENHLVRDRRRQATGANFVVITDAHDERMAEWALANLEASFVFLDEFWRKDIEPMPSPLRTVVYLFQTRNQWAAANTELQGNVAVFATYLAPGMIVGYTEHPSVERLFTFLVHEASHAYNDHHLLPTGVSFPPWLEEGLAEYVANSKIVKGRLVPGEVQKRRFLYLHDLGRSFWVPTESGVDAGVLQADLAKKDSITLPRLLTLERDEFYGEHFPLYYAASWVLIHFLQHGRPDWAPLFPKMMLYAAEGYPIAEVAPAVYGVDLATLDAEYRAYAKSF